VAQPIGIVGAGALARTLGRALVTNGAPVVALASRTAAHAEAAAAFIGGGVRVVDCGSLPACASRIVIATTDAAIRPVAETLAVSMNRGVALHTCGGCGLTPLDPLKVKGVACGLIHPLQTFQTSETDQPSLAGIWFALSGDHEAIGWAQELVTLLAGRAMAIQPEALSLYHAGAALASNGLAGLLDGALAILVAAGLDRRVALDALAPLCRGSLENVLTLGPDAALTGPVARGDVATVEAHVAALKDRLPSLLPLYRTIGRTLIELARRRGVPETSLEQLSQAIK